MSLYYKVKEISKVIMRFRKELDEYLAYGSEVIVLQEVDKNDWEVMREVDV